MYSRNSFYRARPQLRGCGFDPFYEHYKITMLQQFRNRVVYVGGWGMRTKWPQPGNRIRFVRACVRASGRARRGEAACGREATLLPWLDFRTGNSPPARARAVPLRACRAVPFPLP